MASEEERDADEELEWEEIERALYQSDRKDNCGNRMAILIILALFVLLLGCASSGIDPFMPHTWWK